MLDFCEILEFLQKIIVSLASIDAKVKVQKKSGSLFQNIPSQLQLLAETFK